MIGMRLDIKIYSYSDSAHIKSLRGGWVYTNANRIHSKALTGRYLDSGLLTNLKQVAVVAFSVEF